MPVVIMGDGAVGSGLAVALSLSGREVFLAGPPGTPAGSREIVAEGFIGGRGRVSVGDAFAAPRGAVMVCALKAYHLAGALEGIAAGAPARLINVSNGLFEAGEWGGFTPEPAVLTAGFRLENRVVLTASGELTVVRKGVAEELFRGTSLPVRPVEDIQLQVQAKWLVNSIVNPLGAITGLPNNGLLPAGLSELAETLFRELAPAVRDDCRNASRAMLRAVLEKSENLCSMLQDVREGRPTELPWLTEYALRRLGPDRCPAAAAVCALAVAAGSSAKGG